MQVLSDAVNLYLDVLVVFSALEQSLEAQICLIQILPKMSKYQRWFEIVTFNEKEMISIHRNPQFYWSSRLLVRDARNQEFTSLEGR